MRASCAGLVCVIAACGVPPATLDSDIVRLGARQDVSLVKEADRLKWVTVDGLVATPVEAPPPTENGDKTTLHFPFTMDDRTGTTWKAECELAWSRGHSTIAMTVDDGTIVTCLFRVVGPRTEGMRRVFLMWSSKGLGLDGDKAWDGSLDMTVYTRPDQTEDRQRQMHLFGNSNAVNFRTVVGKDDPVDEGVRAAMQWKPPAAWRAPNLDADRLVAITLAEAALLMLEGQPRSP
jgi:hypothetical protein